MKIVFFVYGSRGDVQPMLALATALKEKGHNILFIANPENEELVKSYDCNFVPFGPNVKEQIKENARLKRSPFKASSSAMKEFKGYIEDQMNLLPDIIKGSDLILNAGLGMGVATAADIANVRYRFIIFYPMLLGAGTEGPFFSRFKEKAGVFMANVLLRSSINKIRAKEGVKPIEDVSKSYAGKHVIVAVEPSLNQVKKGVTATYTQTGYMFLPSKIGLPGIAEKFIAAGTPPVFIGFGSNPIYYPQELSQMFERISKETGQRLIVSRGWSELVPGNSSGEVLYVDEMPYELLFPKMAAVIHHGGTGTMAYAARAGVPQAGFPYMADQFSNRDQIAKLGIGPKTCDFLKMTGKDISAAITECVTNDMYRNNSAEISQKIKKTDGLKLTVSLIEEEFKYFNGSQPDKKP
jgi:vancomycin aglycone glucosyltransferase